MHAATLAWGAVLPAPAATSRRPRCLARASRAPARCAATVEAPKGAAQQPPASGAAAAVAGAADARAGAATAPAPLPRPPHIPVTESICMEGARDQGGAKVVHCCAATSPRAKSSHSAAKLRLRG